MSYQVTEAPQQTNHVLHLILTLVTCGLWAPVWVLMAIINALSTKTTVTRQYGPPAVQAHPVPYQWGPPVQGRPMLAPGQDPRESGWNR